jgi:hypothetical protein
MMYLFMQILERVVPNFIALEKRRVIFFIGLVFVGLNTLYFTNLIPPIPLSLKHIGIYHNVVRIDDGSYKVTYEKPAWYMWYRDSDSVFHYAKGEPILCYASVFAPARLATDIYHRWQYFDPEKKTWIDHGRYAYTIQGGRGDGFRGYTSVTNYRKGTWRCVVETERGQVIGKETFTITSGVQSSMVTKVQ